MEDKHLLLITLVCVLVGVYVVTADVGAPNPSVEVVSDVENQPLIKDVLASDSQERRNRVNAYIVFNTSAYPSTGIRYPITVTNEAGDTVALAFAQNATSAAVALPPNQTLTIQVTTPSDELLAEVTVTAVRDSQ